MSRILIIDDDMPFAELLSAILTSQGHETFIAGGGRSALEMFRLNLQPELILVDLKMDSMDGFQTIRALKAEPACEGAVVVMLTATGGDEAAMQARAQGAAGFLSKPIHPAQVGGQVARFLGDPNLVWLDDHHTVVRAA